MEDIVRDAVIGVGGQWPFIGGGVAVAAFLGWITYKVFQSDWKDLALLPGAATVGVVIAVAVGVPAAMAECRRLYGSDNLEYVTANCDVLVHCSQLPRRVDGSCWE